MSSYAIPKGSTVLVTGITGFIASHVGEHLIKAGFKVRGTARDATKAKWISEHFHQTYGQDSFEVAIVPDFTAKGAFNEAIKGCSGIAHVASDLTFGADPNKVVTPVVAAIEDLLDTASREPSIKRFVYTSSSAATSNQVPGQKEHIDANSWNTPAIEEAWKPAPYEESRGLAVYSASKAQAEQAFWKYIQEKKPSFVGNAVLPNFTIGKLLHPNQVGSSAGWLKKISEGDASLLPLFHQLGPQWSVDVEDVATLHVAGLILSDVQNERLMGFSEQFTFNSIMDTIQRVQPDNGKLPERIANPPTLLNTVDRVRSREVLKEMGRGDFVPLEGSVRSLLCA